MPVHGRATLAAICLRQLRRTCEALTEHGIDATAVVVGDDENLDTAADLGFATVVRDNAFTSRKFNDGIDLACDPTQTLPRAPSTKGRYLVGGSHEYRGHKPGQIFEAFIDPAAEARAIERGHIELLERVTVRVGEHSVPSGVTPADYVVPCGSDDWIDWRLLTDLPPAHAVYGFERLSVVREDGAEMKCVLLGYRGGCGLRIIPRTLLEPVGFRPADEDLPRGCDTSMLVNLGRVHGDRLKVLHVPSDARQIVDWKSPDAQLNTYASLDIHRSQQMGDPYAALADFFPAVALNEMRDHYLSAVPA